MLMVSAGGKGEEEEEEEEGGGCQDRYLRTTRTMLHPLPDGKEMHIYDTNNGTDLRRQIGN